MRKYQRAIARNLMQLEGIPRFNKRIHGTRSSFFSLYWRGWWDKLCELYYSPRKSHRRSRKWKKGGSHA